MRRTWTRVLPRCSRSFLRRQQKAELTRDAMNGWALMQSIRCLSGPPDFIFGGVTFKIGTGDAQLSHFVNQRSAFQAEPGGCAFRAADHPADGFERAQNQIAFGVLQSS